MQMAQFSVTMVQKLIKSVQQDYESRSGTFCLMEAYSRTENLGSYLS